MLHFVVDAQTSDRTIAGEAAGSREPMTTQPISTAQRTRMRVRHVSEVSMLSGSAHDTDIAETGTSEPRPVERLAAVQDQGVAHFRIVGFDFGAAFRELPGDFRWLAFPGGHRCGA